MFDGHLSSAVLFSYNAKAVDGQLCLEASPLENPSFFAHSPHATLLEVCITAYTASVYVDNSDPFSGRCVFNLCGINFTTVLQGVQSVVSTLFHSTLHSLGGMQVRHVYLCMHG